MPKTVSDPTTSRRGILAALAGAAFAGGGLTLAVPGNVPAAPGGSGDAELIVACANYHHRHAEWIALDASEEDNDELGELRQAALERVAGLPHATLSGLQAKAAVAHSAMMFDVHTYLDRPWRENASPEEMLALDALRAIAEWAST